MAVTFVGSSPLSPAYYDAAVSGGSGTIVWPTGTAAGDQVIILLIGNGTPSISGTSTWVADWTNQSDGSATNNTSAYHTASLSSTDVSSPPTFTGIDYGSYCAVVYSGGSGVNFGNSVFAYEGFSTVVPGFTKSGTSSVVVGIVAARDSNDSTYVPPSGWTERFNCNTVLTYFTLEVADIASSSYANTSETWTGLLADDSTVGGLWEITVSAAGIYTASLSDTVTSSDSLTATAFGLGRSDTVATSEALTPATGARTATLTDTAASSDSYTAPGAFSAALTDTAASSDARIAIAFGLNTSDTAATSENYTAATEAFSATLTDTAASSDGFSAPGAGQYTATLTDTAASSDSLTGSFAVTTTVLSDTAATSESLVPQFAITPVSLADTAITSDFFSGANTLSDQMVSSDSIAPLLTVTPINLTDTATTSDSVFNVTLAGAANDIVVTSDAFIGLIGTPLILTDTAATGDTLTGVVPSVGQIFGGGFFVPNTARFLLPEGRFDALISEVGQRVGWMRSHACPCTWTQTVANNRLSMVGSAHRSCKTCFGVGFYWDAPGPPFRAYISFMHVTATPDEPGTIMNETFGPALTAEPSITIPYRNTNLSPADPAQPTAAWINASTDDMFVAVDMLSRYTAMLQVGGNTVLPFQQNLQVAPVGAVTVWDPVALTVTPVINYSVNGPVVTVSNYPEGTSYMVEFQAASAWVAWKRAGGAPHIRPFGGGTDNLPRRFRLQTLDPWLRQRGIQSVVGVLPALGTAAGVFADTVTSQDAMSH